MRRLMIMLLCLLLLAGAAVAEEGDSGVYAYSGAWPEMWGERNRPVGCRFLPGACPQTLLAASPDL